MNLKQLQETRDLISELWDFFTSNCSSDETALVESLIPDYEKVMEAITDSRVKIQVRNHVKTLIRRDRKKKK